MIKSLALLTLLIVFSGCSIIHHKDQLLTMADFARNKNEQGKTVDQLNAHYEALVIAVTTQKMKDYPDKSAILGNFGEPIAKKNVVVGLETQEQWLYREAIPQKAKDKIYLYFNSQGKLVKYTQEKIEW